MTLRIYKNEYEEAQITFFKQNFTVVDDTTKVLTISGTQEELDKVMSCMFTDETQFKNVFPAFLTIEERKLFTETKYNEVKRSILDALLEIGNKGVVESQFEQLYNIYKQL